MKLLDVIALTAMLAPAAAAQTVCGPTPAYSPCEVVFELNDAEAAAHPEPYVTVNLEAEFRSPRYRTFKMPGFWDGGRGMVIRFTPTDPGEWVFRISSNIARFDGKELTFTATPSDSPGFIEPANVHHWALVDDLKKTPHLWMGDTVLTFPFIDRAVFEQVVNKRAEQKFNHIRGVIISRDRTSFPERNRPDPAVFRELDDRIRYMNAKGIIADLVLGWDGNHLAELFPEREQRERYIRYAVARYAAFHITWQGVERFEEYTDGRALLKEIGGLLKKLNPYQHPRSTSTAETSSPLLGDEWMNYVSYQSSDDNIGGIEHQLYAVPFVNLGFAREDSGAGRTGPDEVDTNEFRRRLWNATMNGQSPYFANTGTWGGGGANVNPEYLDSPGAKQMTVWYNFFSRTRFWELEPYFDVDGGRAIALQRPREESPEGIEYIVYVENPGPVEIVLPRHSYDIAWFNPVDGTYIKVKGFKADRWMGEPPNKEHDWVLHISREGRKEGLRSYKFESRAIIMQEIEQNPTRAPFEITEPAGQEISVSNPPAYAVSLTRESRATRSMMYLWIGEVAGEEGQYYRVIGTGRKGIFKLSHREGRSYPAPLTVRLYGMNANGKVYSLVRVWSLTK